MASHHQDVLKKALRAFSEAHGRWPRSIDELDPFGMRTFGDHQPSGFGEPTDDAICLRYIHKTGKAVIRVNRTKDETHEI